MDVHADIMACLHALRFDVSELPDPQARACLTNFVDVCGWLYTAEAEDEQQSQETGEVCRRQIFHTHKRSVRLLETLLGSSEEQQKKCDVDGVLQKMEQLIDVSEQLDNLMGITPAVVEEGGTPWSLECDQLVKGKMCADLPSDDEPHYIENLEEERLVSTDNVNGPPPVNTVPVSAVHPPATADEVKVPPVDCEGGDAMSPLGKTGSDRISDLGTGESRSSGGVLPLDHSSAGDTGTLQSPPCDVGGHRTSSGDTPTVTHPSLSGDNPTVTHPSSTGDIPTVTHPSSAGDTAAETHPSSAGDTGKDQASIENTNVQTPNPESITREIVSGLRNLADVALRLEKDEQEVMATNSTLSQRLEALKQEAGSHPAIDVYTARNCHSPLAAKARREEYAQYACAMERVLKKVKKGTQTLRASSSHDLASLEKHLPALQTLSSALAALHTISQDASGCWYKTEHVTTQVELLEEDQAHDEPSHFDNTQPGTINPLQAHDEPSHFNNTQPGTINPHFGTTPVPHSQVPTSRETSVLGVKVNEPEPEADETDGTGRAAEKLTSAVASIGRVRRSVDASLGHVSALLREGPVDSCGRSLARRVGATNAASPTKPAASTIAVNGAINAASVTNTTDACITATATNAAGIANTTSAAPNPTATTATTTAVETTTTTANITATTATTAKSTAAGITTTNTDIIRTTTTTATDTAAGITTTNANITATTATTATESTIPIIPTAAIATTTANITPAAIAITPANVTANTTPATTAATTIAAIATSVTTTTSSDASHAVGDAVLKPPVQGIDGLPSSLQKPTLGEELVAIDTLKYLPLGDKECREHLLAGTRLLTSAVDDLSRAVKAKSASMDTHTLLDNALCRPFPEASILRLELLHLLAPLEETCTATTANKARSRSRSPKKGASPNPRHESDQPAVRGKSRGRRGASSDTAAQKGSKFAECKRMSSMDVLDQRRDKVSPIREEQSVATTRRKHK